MRKHETSAPSLGELSEAATPGPWTAGTPGHGSVYAVYSDDGTGSIIGMFQHRYVFHRTHQQMIDNAQFVARLVSDYRAGRLIDPTAMAEAVASARAEGVKEGLGRAAGTHSKDFQLMLVRIIQRHRNGRDLTETLEGAAGLLKRKGTLSVFRSAPPTLIPGGSSDV